jgi:hypothetical protein
MTTKARRTTAILGCILGGLSLGAGLDGLLATVGNYLTFAFNNGLSPFSGSNVESLPSSPPALPSPASVVLFPLVGALLGLGLGLAVAALIPNDPD